MRDYQIFGIKISYFLNYLQGSPALFISSLAQRKKPLFSQPPAPPCLRRVPTIPPDLPSFKGGRLNRSSCRSHFGILDPSKSRDIVLTSLLTPSLGKGLKGPYSSMVRDNIKHGCMKNKVKN